MVELKEKGSNVHVIDWESYKSSEEVLKIIAKDSLASSSFSSYSTLSQTKAINLQ